jgi:ATP/maltotriose-dependent transcriptional regulator MalT
VLLRLAEARYVSQSDPELIISLLEEALALSREVGDKMGIAVCIRLSGQLALSKGNAAEARSFAGESLALFREIGDRQNTALALCLLARVEAEQGNYPAARTLYEESLDTAARGMDDKGLIPSCLEGLAVVVAAQGELVWAARLWGAAESLRKATGIPLPPVEHPAYERSIATARNLLGDKTFAAAWAEGRTMTSEQALAAQASVTISEEEPAEKELPIGTKPPSPPTYTDDLTAREVEVLRLLAQGWTDTQIAGELVISPRTVNHHLTSIYRKIQVTTRSAATRYAIDHQLV